MLLVGQSIIAFLGFSRRNVADGLQPPPIVEPVRPFERGELDNLNARAFQRTRKALIRVERGMPYWRFAQQRLAGMAAAGVELVPTAAARRAYDEGVRG